ncbi:hypothetical protein AVEN_56216-1 [Araneus ventricosus]|uniref:DNA helicase Pif1-like 2B domain-containing protein n=1 Tax=Araneus ventricosus TaxID=182803 RepID=A0A4Y2P3B4_ARAVE|nr:hypothetical protein AVEN_56216-1 [Araneus ventricosus]
MGNIVSGDINKTEGLQNKLEIFNGAKVMLRSNINIEQGLVNGAMGTITEIVWPLFRRDQMYGYRHSICSYRLWQRRNSFDQTKIDTVSGTPKLWNNRANTAPINTVLGLHSP